MGLDVIMLTGDNEKTANAIKDKAGIEKVIAKLKPQDKAFAIKDLKKGGKTAMVGDGINDAPALTEADTSIAIGAGTDVAIDAANIILVNNNLSGALDAIKIGRATLKVIYQNLFWAFIYNVIGIPLAAGVFGLELSPMIAALFMSMSSFCVVSNALRLNRYKREKSIMNKTLKIEGMMCMHCENRVKETLENIDGVQEAIVSHTENKAEVKLSKDLDFEVLKTAVEKQGYKVN